MWISLLQKKASIKTKLSVLVTTTVILVVTILGIYFDNFIKDSYLENARTRIHHGYERLAYNLRNIEHELKEGVAFARSDEKLIASVDLINNYQDKDYYNTYLIDEEKKSIARQLLNRVKLSFNEDIAIYDANDELIAFVTKHNDSYRLGYISYQDGVRNLYGRDEENRYYAANSFQIPKNILVAHKKDEIPDNNSLLTYQNPDNRIVIKVHQDMFNGNNATPIGHIEMSRILDQAYFENFSKEIDLNIQHSFNPIYGRQSALLNKLTSQQLNIQQTDQNYTSIIKQDSLNGAIYYIIKLNKSALNLLLNESRAQFFIFLILVTITIMTLMRYVISRGLDRPLTQLMQQIHKIEHQNYTTSSPVSTGDELEEISININRLAQAVQEREKSLESSRDELEYLSNHDVLTNLPNRRIFTHRLKHALELAARNNNRLAVFFLDLDQFKLVNDTLGHDVGDELLIQVSNRLNQHVRSADTLARIGGDEFNILIENAPDTQELENILEKYMSLFNMPFHCCGHDINISVSIGIALYPEHGQDSVTLIKHADLAMYHSKDAGRNNYSFFSTDLSIYAEERAHLIHALELAVAQCNQFELHYQPKMLAGSHKIVSMEALLRWHSPEMGTISPDTFITLAEETGLITPIGQWVIQQACNDFIRLQEEGILLDHVSINISNIQLNKNNMLTLFEDVIKSTGIKHEQIELEITESYIASDEEKAVKTLKIFHDMGIRLAIDDFGTGYSSMNYLQTLPVTRLKIDKSFVDKIPGSRSSATIIRAIIGLAKSFNLAITAEGVENREQLLFLENEGCDEIQGFYFSKALSLNDFRTYYHSESDRKKQVELEYI